MTTTANKIFVKQSTLAALSLLAAKNDIRYYLNGLLIEWCAHTTKVVATDGHKTGVHNTEVMEITDDKELNFGRGEFIVPSEVIEKLPKPPRGHDPVVTFTCADPEGARLSWVMSVNGVDIGFTAVDGKYPEWRSIIGALVEKGTTGEPAGYNFEYLQQLTKCGDILAGGKKLKHENRIIVYQNGMAAALIKLNGYERDDFIAIVMPQRGMVGGAGEKFPHELARVL